MTNEELADEIIKRLNELLEDGAIRHDVDTLLRQTIPCTPATAANPTIQVRTTTFDGSEQHFLGFLGLLNGIVGADEYGDGLIKAFFENGQLVEFTR